MKMNKHNPILVLLLLALLGAVVVWAGSITGTLQETVKSISWFPKPGKA
jgi:hypothetical protein